MKEGGIWFSKLALDLPQYQAIEATTRLIALSLSNKRNRFEDRKGSWHHFRIEQLLINLIKAAITSIQRLIEPQLVPGADLAAVLGKIDWTAQTAALIREGRSFFVKTYVQISLQRIIEHCLIEYGSAKLAGRMIKNPALAAVRKADRMGRVPAAKSMVITTAYATFLSYATYVFVEWCAIVIEESQKKNIDKPKKLANIRRRCASIGSLNLAMFGFGTLGHAVGTLVKPGIGTNAFGVLFELAPFPLLAN